MKNQIARRTVLWVGESASLGRHGLVNNADEVELPGEVADNLIRTGQAVELEEIQPLLKAPSNDKDDEE